MNLLCFVLRHDQWKLVQHFQHRCITPATHTHSLVNVCRVLSGCPRVRNCRQPERQALAWMSLAAESRIRSPGFAVQTGRCEPGLGDAYGVLLTPASEMSICFSEIRLHEHFILGAAELAKTASLNQMCQGAPVVGLANTQQASVHQVGQTSFQPDRVAGVRRGKKGERGCKGQSLKRERGIKICIDRYRPGRGRLVAPQHMYTHLLQVCTHVATSAQPMNNIIFSRGPHAESEWYWHISRS